MKKITEIRAEDRPREKIGRLGVKNLKNQELIAAIIGRGIPGRDVNRIASDIEKMLDDKKGYICYDDLLCVGGVGEAKAAQIVASFELVRRYFPETEECIKISRPEDVLPLVNDLKYKKQEHFVCISVNGAGEMIEKRTITVGILNHSPVHPREVFSDAITDRAASVIFVHNHPSGNPEPSMQDIEITKRLNEAGEILGITVSDHVIVAKKGYVSLKGRGFF
ncbi:DNA repair protein RadC [Methanoplanus sp. FWC-SCC4]|uniref:DNA repair protein RadC n=1 Tax=Methanochimaera problematica TaxID=2609417 RepID=A0AA97I247_9EURY|nr:DNA repair protein RadC [Methanoplanus sp. FWC-SCC4]WOF15223.1 DNA repair protein RadC [Methanoplanus sp. FWC-SCC4]